MKRFLLIIASILTAVTLFAQSFAGKTYSSTMTGNGAKVTITVKFTSSTNGVMTFVGSGNGKKTSDKMYFRYEVSGDIINAHMQDGGIGYFVIGDEDNIIIQDDYGNSAYDLKRVTGNTSSGSKKSSKASNKQRR